MTWRATVLTLFPEMFPGPLGHSLAGRARDTGRWSLQATDIRDFATDRHRTVDDTPFGGGAGMVLRADVADAAIAAVADDRPLLALTPRGRPFTQDQAARLAAGPGAILLCGRYEGIDQRVIEARGLEEVSIGDYVLSGGELAAMVLLDAAVRLLPGVMGAAASAEEESFSAGLLEYPHYTRPADWCGRRVPDVLLSGNHAAIAAWRRAEAETITRTRRPDLWARHAAARCQKPRGDIIRSARKDRTPMNIIQAYEAEQIARLTADRAVPEFAPGDTVRVSVKVVEGERSRTQAFEGVVIARSNKGLNSNFTVRKISYGEGVERVFPLYSPTIADIAVVRRGDVRRAKLYYLRGRSGKSARIAEKARSTETPAAAASAE